MARYALLLLGAIYQILTGGQTLANSSYDPPSRPPRDQDRGSNSGQGMSGMAIATLILGIGAWTFLPIIGAFIGAVVGWMELKNIERGESPRSGKTITKIGFWLSIANIAFAVLGSCVTVALIVFVFGSLGAMLSEIGVQGMIAL